MFSLCFNLYHIYTACSTTTTVQDVASGGNQGGTTGVSTYAGAGAAREDEDNVSWNVSGQAKKKAAKKNKKH